MRNQLKKLRNKFYKKYGSLKRQEYDKKYILSSIDINNYNSLNRVISFAEAFFLIDFG